MALQVDYFSAWISVIMLQTTLLVMGILKRLRILQKTIGRNSGDLIPL